MEAFALLPNNVPELNDGKRSLPKLLRKPVVGPITPEEPENNPPTTEGPAAPVEPGNIVEVELFTPNIGVGSAGFMKRSLARRFCKEKKIA